MKIFIFIAIVFIVLALMKIYIYKRFLSRTYIFKARKLLAIALLCALYIAELCFFFIARGGEFNHNIYMWLSYSIVIAYCLFLCAMIADIIIMLARILYNKNATSHNHIDIKRRNFIKILFDLGIFIIFFIATFKVSRNALHTPDIKEVHIKLHRLKQPKTIAMVSDVHVGKIIQSEFLQDMVDKINSIQADIVVIVGDLVDDNIDLIKDHLLILNNIKSKEGIFYVSGNHEYYHGIESILDFLKTLNMTLLTNSNIELQDINIAGINDIAGYRFKLLEPDIQAAKQGLNPNKPSILLTHQPKSLQMFDCSDFDLILCGHTHAGQVFPLSIFVWLDQHYVHGLYDIYDHTKLYVSSGVGFWGPPIRFLAPSEIVKIQLSA